MPQRVGDWGNGFMPCGEDEGESALASYRCAEAAVSYTHLTLPTNREV